MGVCPFFIWILSMDGNLTSKVVGLITPLVEALGYELWGCELKGLGKHTLLRVYIDSEHGVTLDDCAKVSTQISGILDVEELITEKYDLEVSSPGMDRQLFKVEHYARFIGNKVRIKLFAPHHGRRNYVGEIKAVTASEVSIVIDEVVVIFPIANIEKANLVLEF